MSKLLKQCIAEFIGTFVLVFCACGVAAATGGSLVATALTFGLVIVAMAYSIGRISGCHINPAVSLGCFLTKRMTAKEFAGYVVAQVLGGFIGAVLVFGLFKMSNVELVGNACNTPVGGEFKAGGIIAAIITEVVLTCIFVYTILNVTSEKSGTGKMAGIIIGLTLTLVHLIGICLTGTSVNPARSIATAFADLIYNQSVESLKSVWIFILAPLGGAGCAAALYLFLHKEDSVIAENEEPEFSTAKESENTEEDK